MCTAIAAPPLAAMWSGHIQQQGVLAHAAKNRRGISCRAISVHMGKALCVWLRRAHIQHMPTWPKRNRQASMECGQGDGAPAVVYLDRDFGSRLVRGVCVGEVCAVLRYSRLPAVCAGLLSANHLPRASGFTRQRLRPGEGQCPLSWLVWRCVCGNGHVGSTLNVPDSCWGEVWLSLYPTPPVWTPEQPLRQQ